jgi:SAM-dependent methyltransferase
LQPPTAYSPTRYLLSKKTVDDRALNKDVVERLRRDLASPRNAPLNVLEIGGGLGTMVARLIDWKVIRRANYVLLDADEALIAQATDWVSAWARARGHAIDETPAGLRIGEDEQIDVTVTFVASELLDYLEREKGEDGSVDLLIANAFLDLVDVPAVLPPLLKRLSPTGLYWFSINFDGETIFEPAHRDDLKLLDVYHNTMDERVRRGHPSGDSHAGRHLFEHLRTAGAEVLAAGASDWIVFPESSRYDGDEAYFLHHIVHTVEESLGKHPDVDGSVLAEWAAERHGQIVRSELVYIAHQIDFVGHGARSRPPVSRPPTSKR